MGEPRRRFEEDALRLMRALRFAGAYDLRIVPETAAALHEKQEGLRFVAAERLRAELDRFLVTAGVDRMLTEYPDILAVFLPFIAPMVGFEQHSVYHHLDVWRHTAACVAAAIPDRDVRLALLLHDAGKAVPLHPRRGRARPFYGHAPASASIAEEAAPRFEIRPENTGNPSSVSSGIMTRPSLPNRPRSNAGFADSGKRNSAF